MIGNEKIGRAIVEQHSDELRIIIPAKKQWLGIVFLLFVYLVWLWASLSLLVSGSLDLNELFIKFFLAVWILMGFTQIRTLIWIFWGKEVISLRKNSLKIEKLIFGLGRRRKFDRSVVSALGMHDRFRYSLFGRRSIMHPIGKLSFKKGQKIIQFAGDLEKETAKKILEKIKKSAFLNKEQFVA